MSAFIASASRVPREKRVYCSISRAPAGDGCSNLSYGDPWILRRTNLSFMFRLRSCVALSVARVHKKYKNIFTERIYVRSKLKVVGFRTRIQGQNTPLLTTVDRYLD